MARSEKGGVDKGGGQAGAIGMASDAHQLQEGADRDAPELRGDLGVGGSATRKAAVATPRRRAAGPRRRPKAERTTA
jgi:hypothetical protein